MKKLPTFVLLALMSMSIEATLTLKEVRTASNTVCKSNYANLAIWLGEGSMIYPFPLIIAFREGAVPGPLSAW